MTREQYIHLLNQKDPTPILFFYYRLNGGKIENQQKFADLFCMWLINGWNTNYFSNIIEWVIEELNEYFKI